MSDIDVSFVMTVYNKERYLPSVLKALLNQTGLKNPEFIFCDDVSKDRSVEIIEEMTKGIPNVKIFKTRESLRRKENTSGCWTATTFFLWILPKK